MKFRQNGFVFSKAAQLFYQKFSGVSLSVSFCSENAEPYMYAVKPVNNDPATSSNLNPLFSA
jgi:hypothetical protein